MPNENNTNQNPLPHITVATVVEKNSRFLMVIEESSGKKVYNQPAGHLENNETLVNAAIRETLEETGWHVKLKNFLGVSQYQAPNGVTYVRHSFSAVPIRFDESITRDDDIIDTVWLPYDEICDSNLNLRSPLVKHDIDRYRSGKFYQLSILDGFV